MFIAPTRACRVARTAGALACLRARRLRSRRQYNFLDALPTACSFACAFAAATGLGCSGAARQRAGVRGFAHDSTALVRTPPNGPGCGRREAGSGVSSNGHCRYRSGVRHMPRPGSRGAARAARRLRGRRAGALWHFYQSALVPSACQPSRTSSVARPDLTRVSPSNPRRSLPSVPAPVCRPRRMPSGSLHVHSHWAAWPANHRK